MTEITFGKRLRIVMILADMEPKHLAAATGINLTTVYKVLQDQHLLRMDQLSEILRVLEQEVPGAHRLLFGDQKHRGGTAK